MQWRLSPAPHGGWMIEYKEGWFGCWQTVSQSRRFAFEPYQTQVFKSKQEAANEMAKLISKYD